MKRTALSIAVLMLACICASAHENKLQYSFIANSSARSVIGMQFINNADGSLSVQGNVSFYTTPSGCRYVCPRTYYHYIATWDGLGNFLSQTVGSLPAQPILSTNGTEQVYAQGYHSDSRCDPACPASTTGHDTRYNYGGFVDIPASHYTWQTANHQYAVIPYTPPYQLSATLLSDGDFPLNVQAFSTATDCRTCYYNQTAGTATVTSTDCSVVAVSSTCSFQITYDPSNPPMSSFSGQGLGYTDLFLYITTDAGVLPSDSWEQQYTITGVPGGGGD